MTSKKHPTEGRVSLVGAGPGDPGLITVKAVDCLREADVVVYDYLANPKLLDLAPGHSEKIYVGKRGAFHAQEQEDINRLLIARAKGGKKVVRLKGGDPFVFGRGGEEAEALAKAGISFDVIPGVTSAIAVPAYAGIPVTHRDFTPAVTFVTGHEKNDAGAHSPMTPDWEALARIGTVVFLMSYANLPNIVERLVAAGRSPETPVAVIQWGTTGRQRTVTGRLGDIIQKVAQAGVKPPTITVVGEVVALHGQINWFESKPLFGKKIVVTRSREQAGVLSRLLEREGAQVFEIAALRLEPPRSWKGLDRAIQNVKRYDWILFTSVNGVKIFQERFCKNKKDLRSLSGVRLAAIGPATAQALRDRGLQADLTANDFRAEGVIRAFRKIPLKGKKILMPRAREGRKILVESLQSRGARVDLVEAYQSVHTAEGAEVLGKIIREQKPDLLTFASSSTVLHFLELARLAGVEKESRSIPVACIGPITSATAKKEGLNVVIQPSSATIPELVKAIADYSAFKTSS